MKNCPRCFATYPDEYAVCPKDGARLTGESVWESNAVIRGKYKILAKIGEGGMAAVYKALHLLLDEPRALKVISLDLARDEQFVRRFKNEAIITRKLQHPNAVRVDDLDLAEDGRPFIAMELVEGETLKSLILRAGPLPVSQVLDVALQVCEALQAAHLLGLIHRDIKPDNIFLVPRRDATPLAKILDFGIARLKESVPGAARAGMTLTGTGVVMGTPEYMSPEQAMGKRGDELEGRSDLYSLGIVMYRMLTGELPFKADTTVEMILHHIQTTPKPPQTLKPQLGIPLPVSAIVMKALQKDREKRFASAASMVEAIRLAREKLTAARGVPVGITQTARSAASGLQTEGPESASITPEDSRERLLSSGRHETRPPEARPSRELGRPDKGGAAETSAMHDVEKKPFPIFQTLLAVAVLAVVVIGITAIRRRQPAHSQPETIPSTASPPQSSTVTSEAPVPSGTSPATSVEPTETQQHPAPPSTPPPAGQGETSPATSGELGGTDLQSSEAPDSGAGPTRGQQLRRNREPGTGQDQMGSGKEQPETGQLMGMGAQYYSQGEYGKAARAFRQVLAVDPNNRQARMGLQKCFEAMMRERRQSGRRRP